MGLNFMRQLFTLYANQVYLMMTYKKKITLHDFFYIENA